MQNRQQLLAELMALYASRPVEFLDDNEVEDNSEELSNSEEEK